MDQETGTERESAEPVKQRQTRREWFLAKMERLLLGFTNLLTAGRSRPGGPGRARTRHPLAASAATP